MGGNRSPSLGDILIAYRLDRLARDVYLSELIQREARKRGADIEVVEGAANGNTPEQQMIRQVLQAFAEYERKVIAARTRAAMLRHQAKGRKMSAQAPYGWQTDPADPSRLIEQAAEQTVIKRIVALRKQGQGLREIARTLDAERHPARETRWYHATIKHILARADRAA